MKHIFLHILISAIITAGGLYFYHQHYEMKLATFDMPVYVKHLRQEYNQGNLDVNGLNQKLQALSSHLKNDYKNTVVLMKEAVISGKIQEITPSK